MEHTEEFLGSHPELLPAVASLRNVRLLRVHCVGTLGAVLLDELRSPVTDACVDYLEGGRGLPENIPFFSSFQETLKELTLGSVPHDYAIPHILWPNVTSLTITREAWHPYELRNLSYSFPNLTYLDYSNREDYTLDDSLPIRRQSMAVSYRPWSHLETFYCSVDSAFNLALRCPVRRWSGAHVMLGRIFSFNAALRDMRPKYLDLILDISHLGHPTAFAGMFVSAPMSLTHLRVDISTLNIAMTWKLPREQWEQKLFRIFASALCCLPRVFVS